MRIEQLEHLTAVTRHGSLRRASEQLHLSQPALSESVRNLERELGVTLLDRRRSGARISRDGQELLGSMQEVLDAVERLRSAAGTAQHTTRTVRLVQAGAGSAAVLAPAVHTFTRVRPGGRVDLLTAGRGELVQALVEGRADLGLITLAGDEELPEGLVGVDLLLGSPVVVVPAGHPLAAASAVTGSQLAGERLVGVRDPHPMPLGGRAGDAPVVVCTVDGPETGTALVARGVGVAVLPDFSVAHDALVRTGALLTRPLVPPTRVRLVLLHRGAVRLPRACADLAAALARQAALLTGSAGSAGRGTGAVSAPARTPSA